MKPAPPAAPFGMIDSIPLGPLVLPPGLLLVAAATGIGYWIGERVAGRRGVAVGDRLQLVLAVAVLAARLAFVIRHHEVYARAPWSVLDIRDGGWAPGTGLIAAWLAALLLGRRPPALRRPMLAALGAASIVWLAGAGLLALPAREARPLPAFSATALDGGAVPLPGFAGKPTVINLWATWCPPCRRELPALARAQRERPDVHVVFLNQRESADTVRRFLDGQRLAPDHVLLDPGGDVARAFEARGLPTTLFFDAAGRLVDVRVGELSDATLAERLARLGSARR